MRIITLTTDYGLTDHRVAAIKGKILSLKDDANVVDISHNIQPYNLLQASYVVRNAYPNFPKGTVNIVAVDSLYSKHTKSLLYKVDDQYFIAPDNGILSLVFFDLKPDAVYEITIGNRFDDEVNFLATDVFAPAATHLQNGGLPEVIGRIYRTPKQIRFLNPTINENEKMIIGEVMYIDHFGNIISNISKSFFNKVMVNFQKFRIKVRNIIITEIQEYYTDVVKDWENENQYHGTSIAIFNEANLMELSIYKGSKANGAHSLYGMNLGDKIYIEFE